MKITIALLLVSTLSFGQITRLKTYSPSQTTLEEYTYITKGFKDEVEKALDTKKGYEWITFHAETDGKYSFEFRYFIRTDKKELAATAIIAKSLAWGNTYYVCIPNDAASPLMKNYSEKIISWDLSMSKAYINALCSAFNAPSHLQYLVISDPNYASTQGDR